MQENYMTTDPVAEQMQSADVTTDTVVEHENQPTELTESKPKELPPIDDLEGLLGNKVFQLISEKKIEKFIEGLDFDKLQEFVDATKDPDFGKKGVYGYYCKACGGSWNFTTKATKIFFEKFHRATGCALGVNLERAAQENVLVIKRSKQNHMSLKATQFIAALIEKRTLKEDETENKIAA